MLKVSSFVAALLIMPTAVTARNTIPKLSESWTAVAETAHSLSANEGVAVAADVNQVEQSFFRPERQTSGRFSTPVSLDEIKARPELRCNNGRINQLTTFNRPMKAPALAAAVTVKTGTMLAADTSKEGAVYRSVMTLTDKGEGVYTLNNLFGLESDITVNIDSVTGQVTIPCQKVAYISGYGDLKSVRWDRWAAVGATPCRMFTVPLMPMAT